MAGEGPGLSATDNQTAGRAAKGVLLVVCVALFFAVFEASAISVILPDIADDLSVDTGQLSWLMTGFLLIYGIAIPFYGRLADRYGARPLFLIGVAVFSLGSLLSALAPSYSFLLGARIIQAIGGAAVPGLGMTLASRAYGPESRGTVLGVIAATIGLSGAIGPLLDRAIPVIVVMALSLTLPRASGLAAVGPTVAAQPVSPPTNNWVANCSVPWMPECVEATPPADLGRLLR